MPLRRGRGQEESGREIDKVRERERVREREMKVRIEENIQDNTKRHNDLLVWRRREV